MFRKPRLRQMVGGYAISVAMIAATPGFAAISAPAVPASPLDTWSYADVADLFTGVPVVARVRIADAIPVSPEKGEQASATRIRYYLVGDVIALIRGTGGVAPRVAWLADVARDGRGKPPKLKKAMMILAALPVPGRPGELRLAAGDAMVPWSATGEGRIRAVIADALAPDTPPRVTGILSAFHSPGNLPGESETQIFVATASKEPVSLSILRRPGMEPRWAVALGEIVDEAAKPPERDTLGWYRLACFLPATMPEEATAELSPTDAEAARTDYRFVVATLGPCKRNRG